MDIERPPKLRSPGTEPRKRDAARWQRVSAGPAADQRARRARRRPDRCHRPCTGRQAGPGPGAAGTGSSRDALVEQQRRLERRPRAPLAARHQMPLVDLALTGVAEEAAREIALHVLSASSRFRTRSTRRHPHVASADPGNMQGDRRVQARDAPHRWSSAVPPGTTSRRRPPARPSVRGVRRPCRRRGGAGPARKRRTTPTTSRSTTASPTRRSSGSSTP